MEDIDRGLVAVPSGDGVLVRWRLLATDDRDVGFNLYRDGELANDSPITDSTNYLDADGTTDASYAVRPVVDGEEGERSKVVDTWDQQYRDIPLNRPDPHVSPDGTVATYSPNDASVGDLTGDGSYDIVLKWSPSNSKDNAHDGYTAPFILDGYQLDGTHLWRINIGKNVRAGAHYLQFLVYDFDGDGIAEIACRTADGTTDGEGNVIGDADADHRTDNGRILSGPEYVTVFDGETGAALDTVDYRPARGDLASWGDTYGNRGYRFLAGVAYLDGKRPSIVHGRGYYEKTMLSAFDFRDGEITHRWTFDSTDGNQDYEGKGAHSMSTADVDGDGKDEIVYGGAVIDHDGTGLHTTSMVNPDAQHCGNFLPGRAGLEIFVPSEHPPEGAPTASMRDAETGEYIWSVEGDDAGRAMVSDVDPNYQGAEAWASGGVGTWTANGKKLQDEPISSINSGIWWTDDLHRELLDHEWLGDDGIPKIDKWRWNSRELETIATLPETRSNNYTKGNPCLSGDILGDWREELLVRRQDNEALRLFATPYQTYYRLYTLMHDPMYRTGIARQNVGYNQPPWPSFFLGHGMETPPAPKLKLVGTNR